MIVFASCVGRKLEHPAAAQDLYQSAWFKKARAYAEYYGERWYILSAKYGLVAPSAVIEPYDLTLNAMRKSARADWAEMIMAHISDLADGIPARAHVQVLAGWRYREHLVPLLEQAGYAVEVPMAGLGIGQQLAWLNRKIDEAERKLAAIQWIEHVRERNCDDCAPFVDYLPE